LKKEYLFKIAGIKFTVYRVILTVFFTVLATWGVNNYLYKQKAFEDSANTVAKVTYLRNSKGKRVSLYPFITYEFYVNGMRIEGNQKAEQGLEPKIGDCISITYSNQDPEVSRIDFEKGIVPCDTN
jgi:hypothetical protein